MNDLALDACFALACIHQVAFGLVVTYKDNFLGCLYRHDRLFTIIWYFQYFYMWFSRYNFFDWCFISHLRPEIFSELKSLVKPVIRTALPCWPGWSQMYFEGHSQAIFIQISPLQNFLPPDICIYIQRSISFLFYFHSGGHLLSHTVSSAVPSAA